MNNVCAIRHPFTVDCLKQYLRELPDPLLTYAMFDDWKKAARYSVCVQSTKGDPP